jgi:hypothetical protein
MAAMSTLLHQPVGLPFHPGVLVASPPCSAPSLSRHARGRGEAITSRHTGVGKQASRKAVVPQVAEGVNLLVGAVTVAGLVIWEADGIGQ